MGKIPKKWEFIPEAGFSRQPGLISVGCIGTEHDLIFDPAKALDIVEMLSLFPGLHPKE